MYRIALLLPLLGLAGCGDPTPSPVPPLPAVAVTQTAVVTALPFLLRPRSAAVVTLTAQAAHTEIVQINATLTAYAQPAP